MRVLVVGISRFAAPSGICRYADRIASAASRSGQVQTTIAVGAWQKDYFCSIFKSDLHSRIVSIDIENSSLSRNMWAIRTLPQLATDVRADVIHLAYPMPFLRRRFSHPVVLTVHDLYPFDIPRNFRLPITNRLILRSAVHQADAVICVSNNTLHRFRELFPRKYSVARIYNPVSMPRFESEGLAIGDLRRKGFLLAVGQHRRNKNLDLLQRSFVHLRTTRQIPGDCQLVIVGSTGPETSALHGLTHSLGLAGHVRYLSSISESQLGWLYRNCLAMVVPSSHEGFCLPVVEALLSGAHVVCSNIPVLREVGSDACTYFEPEADSIQHLSSAIINSIKSPIRDTFVNDSFVPDNVARELYGIYQTVAGQSHPAPASTA
jgi:glycosyltransferase involved in cell wall biosynthesis